MHIEPMPEKQVDRVRDPELYRAILESLHDGVYFVDCDRRIIFWNEGAEQITGYLRHEVLGRHCVENILMHCDDHGRQLCLGGCPLAATLTDGRPRETRVFLRHKEGYRLPVRVTVKPVRGTGGEIEGAVEIFERVNDSGPAERTHGLEQYGCLDPLTGIGSRAYTEMQLEHAIAEMDAWLVPFGLLRVDIDRFAGFNHRYGEAAGDMLLKVLARTLSKGLRSHDVLGRWGEDEYLVLIRACPLGELRRAADRLRGLVSISAAPWWGDWIETTVSIGGVLAHPGDTAAELDSRAGVCLERSRAAGGNAANVLDG